MSTLAAAQLSVDAALMLPDLPLSICQEIAQLANPHGRSRLSEERFQEVSVCLNTSCHSLKARMAQSTRTESQELMPMHEALKAVLEVMTLLHPPA